VPGRPLSPQPTVGKPSDLLKAMALHLFPNPVECTNCGLKVDDPNVDRCPRCGELLKERRTPSRLAGVERKYENLRLLLGFVRFLGVITGLVGLLLFLFAEEGTSLNTRVLLLLASVLIGTSLFVVAALIQIIADLEENSRASFRIEQSILERLSGPRPVDGD
jgi:predicted RNA-binding Zn-ribbon protein involved in translation (DUF1610 family)